MNVQGTPLQTGYSFYYMRRSKKGNTAVLSEAEPDAQASLKDRASFTDAVKLIGTARTIEEFWGIYNHLVRPSDLPATTDYHFFREGIQPTWESTSERPAGQDGKAADPVSEVWQWIRLTILTVVEKDDKGEDIVVREVYLVNQQVRVRRPENRRSTVIH